MTADDKKQLKEVLQALLRELSSGPGEDLYYQKLSSLEKDLDHLSLSEAHDSLEEIRHSIKNLS